jgi:hypothetical protein
MLGEVFGRLTVIAAAESKCSHKRWLCRCECGNERIVWQLSLRRGHTKSCGCYASDSKRARWVNRADRFWLKVEKTTNEACWNWTGLKKRGPKNPTPYGQLGWKGKVTSAHRVAYEIANGEIPVGAMVLHKCDNTLCCNPKHLYLGDHDRNMRDMVERNRRKGVASGEANGRAKLTQAQAEEIRAIYAQGVRSQQSIADEYGVSQYAVSRIVRNLRYAT